MNAETEKDLQTETEDNINHAEAETSTDENAETPEVVEDSASNQDETPESQLEAKELEIKELTDRLMRSQADFQNYKKRKEKEQSEVFTQIEDRLIKEFLPLFDDYQRAFEVYGNDQKQDALIEGMERIFAKFKDFLESKDMQTVETVGQKFDPAFHEVLLTVESDGEANIILDEYEKGYTRQGRLLRASRVTVSKPPAAPETTASENEEMNESEKES